MVRGSVGGVDVAGVPTAVKVLPKAVCTSEVVHGAIGRLVGEDEVLVLGSAALGFVTTNRHG